MDSKKGFSEKDLTPEQKRQFEAMKNTASRYKGKSEAELMRELKRTVEKDKAAGKLTDSKMDNFSKKISPMLNEQQRKKLNKIMKELKNK